MTVKTQIDTHYAGRRLSTKSTALYVFEREDGGEPLAFSKRVVHVGIGTQVTFTESDTPGSVWTGGENGPKIGYANDASEAKLIEWNAADRVCAQQLADLAHARKTQREAVDPLADAIETLRKAMDSQRGFGAKAALWRHIEQEVNR